MAKTIAERLTAGLLALGWKPDPMNRSRYDAFTHHDHKSSMFVGRNGALRYGECASRSHSISEPPTVYYRRVMEAGDKALGAPKVEVKSPVGLLGQAQRMLAGITLEERRRLILG